MSERDLQWFWEVQDEWADPSFHPICRQETQGMVIRSSLRPYAQELETIHKMGGKLLDIGAGGGLQIYFPTTLLPRVTAIDWSENALQSNPAEVRIAQNIEQGFPLPSNSYDTATMFFVTRYMQNVEQVTREAVRVLRPGGLLLVMDFSTLGIGFPIERSSFDPEKFQLMRAVEHLTDCTCVQVLPAVGEFRGPLFLFAGRKRHES